MPCPFQESLQDASTDSEQYFSQNRMYGRFEIHCQKKEKMKKSQGYSKLLILPHEYNY